MFFIILTKYLDGHTVLQTLRLYNPYLDSGVRRCLQASGIVAAKQERPSTAWMVLPFHWLWSMAGLNDVLRDMSNSVLHQQLTAAFGRLPFERVRISWKLSGLKFVDAAKSWQCQADHVTFR